MASFFKKIKNYVKEAFDDDEDLTDSRSKQGSTLNVRGEKPYEEMFDDVDTDAIDVSDILFDEDETSDATGIGIAPFKEEDVDYSEYWWCYEGNAADSVSIYDEIDPEVINDELNKRIELGQFPIIEIPENAMKAIEILNKDDFDFASVADLINKSPAMAGEFLSLVNSSAYSRGVKINDLRVALPRVGPENVKAMLYLYSTKMSLASSPALNDLAVKIVDHSYATAIIASYMSQRFFPDPDTAFLAGLLHDVGKLGIIKAITEDHSFISSIEGDLMEEHFGNTFQNLHETLGVFLARRWSIDELVVSAIEHHHDFFEYGFDYDEQEHFSLSALINLSDVMAKVLGKGRQVEPVDIFELAATRELNIERDKSTIDFLEEIPGIVSFKSSR